MENLAPVETPAQATLEAALSVVAAISSISNVDFDIWRYACAGDLVVSAMFCRRTTFLSDNVVLGRSEVLQRAMITSRIHRQALPLSHRILCGT